MTAVFSGGAAVASELIERAKDPTSIPELLATQLPRASNFYLTYFIIQGTTSAANNLLNYSDLFQYLFLGYAVDKTPRQKFSRYTSMKGMSWGKVFPKVRRILPPEPFNKEIIINLYSNIVCKLCYNWSVLFLDTTRFHLHVRLI